MPIFKQPTDEEILKYAQDFIKANPTKNDLFSLMKHLKSQVKVLVEMGENQPFADLTELMNNNTQKSQLATGLTGAKVSIKRILNNQGKAPKELKLDIAQTTTPLTSEEIATLFTGIKKARYREDIEALIKSVFNSHTHTALTEDQQDKVRFGLECKDKGITIPTSWDCEIKTLSEATVRFPNNLSDMVKTLMASSDIEEFCTAYYRADKKPEAQGETN